MKKIDVDLDSVHDSHAAPRILASALPTPESMPSIAMADEAETSRRESNLLSLLVSPADSSSNLRSDNAN